MPNPNPEEYSNKSVYRRVRDVLIRVQALFTYDEIVFKHNLETDYKLGPDARSGLTAKLNDRFTDIDVRIPEPKVRTSDTVKALVRVCIQAVRAKYNVGHS